jgi:hypothetical protein
MGRKLNAIMAAVLVSGCGAGPFDEARVRKAISDTAYEYTDIDYRGGQQEGTVVTVSFDRSGAKCRMRAVRVSDKAVLTDLSYNLDSIVVGQCQSLNKTCAQISCLPENESKPLQIFVTETELGRGIHLFDSYILRK